MCYTVFIATSTPQQTSEFIPDVTRLYLKLPGEKDLEGLKDKLTLPHIYYVGADTQCSCGFEFHSEYFDDPEWQDSKASPQALLDLLVELTAQNDVGIIAAGMAILMMKSRTAGQLMSGKFRLRKTILS